LRRGWEVEEREKKEARKELEEKLADLRRKREDRDEA
jgi:hypothetical protein